MNLLFLLIFTISLFLYGSLNYYIGLRGWQSLGVFIPFLKAKWYWAAFWIIAFSYILGRLTKRFLPSMVTHPMVEIGAYWLGAMVYFAMIYMIADVMGYLTKRMGWTIFDYKSGPFMGTFIFLLVVGLLFYGSWSARNPRVIDYQVQIHKSVKNMEALKVAMVSDIHLGTTIHNGRLLKLVENINRLKPDLILIPGDIIDENIQPFIEQNMAESFSKLKAPLGVYAVMGNHEYIGGHSEEIYEHLTKAGVKVLRDEAVLVKDSFYIVGREDSAYERFQQKSRKTMKEIMAHVDDTLPILLLAHQPQELEEYKEAGVDLQVSGHTHRGQLFPFFLITQRIFEVDWGHLQKEEYNVIVSSGYGTWGPPLRVGHRSEIVQIHIQFAK